mmetsp:Transcript_22936/g.31454  ORF Transcript_22936/g.31454 Transcript_22936/m.31454 type:complete len:113 (+) Transcript_22936:66-404(+)
MSVGNNNFFNFGVVQRLHKIIIISTNFQYYIMAGGAGRRAAGQIAREAARGIGLALIIGVTFKVLSVYSYTQALILTSLLHQTFVSDRQKKTINEYYKLHPTDLPSAKGDLH